jgi:hypothetical protein
MEEIEKEDGNHSAGKENRAKSGKDKVNIGESMKDTLRSAVYEADEFFDKFQIGEILCPCNEKQVILFKIYFARYCILKRGYELNRLANSPTYETVRRIPIVGSFVRNLEKENDNDIEVSGILKMAGEGVAKHVMERNISESGNALVTYTMPSVIERAANLLSNTFLEHHKSGSKKRMQAIEGVKDRFKLIGRE